MTTRRNRNTFGRVAERGFTLIELMAVVVILGILGTAVTVGIVRQVDKAKIQGATTQISSLGQAITTFHLECGFYPDSLESLIRPPSSGRTCKGYPPDGFLSKKEIPADSWGNPYNFQSPGVHNTGSYDLWSNGPDGDEGTADDITSWAAEKTE